MEKVQKNKYYGILKEYYINRKVKVDTCERYDNWVTHKYRHTMKVVRAGREIIENDKNLKILPEQVREDFVDACLFHDIARAFQIHPQTGKYTFDFHGVVGAMEAQKNGVTSLNILIPVMLHDLINGALLYLPIYELEIDERYTEQPTENQEFIKEMRDRFWALSDAEKEIVELGRRLVKDADMLANWREFERMSHDVYSSEFIINEKVKNDLYKAHLVNLEYVETFSEYMCLLLAWGTNIYFPYSLQSALDDKIIERIRDLFISENKERGAKDNDLALLVAVFDEGISIVRNKILANIEYHEAKK